MTYGIPACYPPLARCPVQSAGAVSPVLFQQQAHSCQVTAQPVWSQQGSPAHLSVSWTVGEQASESSPACQRCQGFHDHLTPICGLGMPAQGSPWTAVTAGGMGHAGGTEASRLPQLLCLTACGAQACGAECRRRVEPWVEACWRLSVPPESHWVFC